ncbi:MAG: DMT family transporter [Rhodobacteraceae bacterium]|nr:DMT family transporter [Paracoccaceae bacterium]
MNTPEHQPLVGIFWMLITGFCFVAVTALVKHVGGGVPAAEAAFIRYFLGLVFLIPMIPEMLRTRLTGRAVALFSLRGGFHTIAVMMWFFAMTQISIAEVTSMSYLSPVYVTIGAAIFLGERFAARRILAIVAALIGVLIILRPGFRELSLGHFAQLLATLGFAGSFLVAKRLTFEFSATMVVAMLSVTVTIGLAPFAIAVWVPPTLSQLGWLFLVAAFATAGHYTMSRALAAAPITATQPVTFLQLVWAVTLGALVFGEPVDGFVVLGGVIIMAAVGFIAWREAMIRRRSARAIPAHPTQI